MPWLVLVTFARGTAAQADTAAALDAQVSLGAGHDSNALFDIVPAQGDAPRASGFYGQAAPALSAALITGQRQRHRLQLDYQGDFRVSNDFGYLLFQQAGLEYQTPVWQGLRLGLAVDGGMLETGEFPENDFRFIGGALALQADLGTRARLTLGYSPEWRLGTGPTASRERLQQLDARLRVRLASGLAAGAFATHLALAPVDASATTTSLDRTRAGLFAEATWGRVSVWTRGYLGVRSLSAASSLPGPPGALTHRQTELGVAAGVGLRISDALKLLALYDSNHDIGGDALAGNADRQHFGLALVVSGGLRRMSVARIDGDTNLTPLVQKGKVRLRLLAPNARAVHVLGSFDGWGQGAALHRVPEIPGLWELWLPLPVGEHRYHFLVDGTPQKPPLAPRYVPDGFGGEDAVVELRE